MAPATRESGDRRSFYLRARDPQPSDGPSLVVDEVVLTGTKGWVVVHADVAGDFGPVIGVSPLFGPGEAGDVRITFTRPIVASVATVHVMLHHDTDGDGAFHFPGADGPVTGSGGGLVMVPVRLVIG